ncbi:hypothetical protein [Acinetobacter pollinis]|uniref:Uncharacterized protein n=1 Tax=Acinetobacter pollinis TaxID=2605270 RepID=A0ABU6DUZ2_9GAMM|nr:hypothetical protein [Acinetobacter pollinis]MEB5477291.1 hypothetical protein [Acinetobacter pollinis]
MKQTQPIRQSFYTEPKPSMGKGALILCSVILAVSFIYFSFVQADREQINHDLAVATARAQLAELTAQQEVHKLGAK